MCILLYLSFSVFILLLRSRFPNWNSHTMGHAIATVVCFIIFSRLLIMFQLGALCRVHPSQVHLWCYSLKQGAIYLPRRGNSPESHCRHLYHHESWLRWPHRTSWKYQGSFPICIYGGAWPAPHLWKHAYRRGISVVVTFNIFVLPLGQKKKKKEERKKKKCSLPFNSTVVWYVCFLILCFHFLS